MNTSTRDSIIRSVAIITASKLLSFITMSFAIGTFWTVFSFRTMLTPLVGAFGGIVGIGVFCASNLFYALVFKKAMTISFLAYSGIPTVAASLYWATESRVVRIFIPAVCMLLFVSHSQGMYAFPYALYWLIPIAIARYNNSSVFLTALASTFTAHAVGSVLWLYGTGMQASCWYGLLPLVPVERVILAAGMTVSYMIVSRFLLYTPTFSFRLARISQ